jgi:hypothetical protein
MTTSGMSQNVPAWENSRHRAGSPVGRAGVTLLHGPTGAAAWDERLSPLVPAPHDGG